MRWGVNVTYSIVARDPVNGHLGIAVASRFFAVGSLVPHIRGKVGAIATQAFVSPIYGIDGIELLAQGLRPEEVVHLITERDEGCEHRQVHLIDARGHGAAFTGPSCVPWAGHLLAENVSVAGNMLKGPEVIAATLQGYRDNADLPLAERLLCALEAGDGAGGDKRGRQSAALLLFHDQDYPWLSLRVDDHADPLAELRRLNAVAQERYQLYAEMLPTRENIHGVMDRAEFERKVAEWEALRKTRGLASASFATANPDDHAR